MYQPESGESIGGKKLLRKADYQLGQTVNTMFRVQCHQRGVILSYTKRNPFIYENKHSIFFRHFALFAATARKGALSFLHV